MPISPGELCGCGMVPCLGSWSCVKRRQLRAAGRVGAHQGLPALLQRPTRWAQSPGSHPTGTPAPQLTCVGVSRQLCARLSAGALPWYLNPRPETAVPDPGRVSPVASRETLSDPPWCSLRGCSGREQRPHRRVLTGTRRGAGMLEGPRSLTMGGAGTPQRDMPRGHPVLKGDKWPCGHRWRTRSLSL